MGASCERFIQPPKGRGPRVGNCWSSGKWTGYSNFHSQDGVRRTLGKMPRLGIVRVKAGFPPTRQGLRHTRILQWEHLNTNVSSSRKWRMGYGEIPRSQVKPVRKSGNSSGSHGFHGKDRTVSQIPPPHLTFCYLSS